MKPKPPIYPNKIDAIMKERNLKPTPFLAGIAIKYPKSAIAKDAFYDIRKHVRNPSLHEIVQICEALEIKTFPEIFDRELCRKMREESNN